MSIAATAAAGKTRKDRAVAARPFTNNVISSDAGDSSNPLQLQFLAAHFGLSATRATLIAGLCWGGNNG